MQYFEKKNMIFKNRFFFSKSIESCTENIPNHTILDNRHTFTIEPIFFPESHALLGPAPNYCPKVQYWTKKVKYCLHLSPQVQYCSLPVKFPQLLGTDPNYCSQVQYWTKKSNIAHKQSAICRLAKSIIAIWTNIGLHLQYWTSRLLQSNTRQKTQ